MRGLTIAAKHFCEYYTSPCPQGVPYSSTNPQSSISSRELHLNTAPLISNVLIIICELSEVRHPDSIEADCSSSYHINVPQNYWSFTNFNVTSTTPSLLEIRRYGEFCFTRSTSDTRSYSISSSSSRQRINISSPG